MRNPWVFPHIMSIVFGEEEAASSSGYDEDQSGDIERKEFKAAVPVAVHEGKDRRITALFGHLKPLRCRSPLLSIPPLGELRYLQTASFGALLGA